MKLARTRLENQTALQYAVDQNNLEIARILVRNGGDLTEDNGMAYQLATINFNNEAERTPPRKNRGEHRPNRHGPMLDYLKSMEKARKCHSLIHFLVEESALWTTRTTTKRSQRVLPNCTMTSMIDPRTGLYKVNPYHTKPKKQSIITANRRTVLYEVNLYKDNPYRSMAREKNTDR